MFMLCILLCAVSGWTAGQHLGRIPLARVTVTNPGEFGLIPGQPFWPPITTPPPTTTPPLNPPITAASPPVATKHASAHLNEIEVKGGGIRVQDHGYRTPPTGKSKPIAPIILQALRRLEARPGTVQGAGFPTQGGSLPSAATLLLAGNAQALNPVIPGRAPALPVTTTTASPFTTAFPARRPLPRTKALLQTLLRARNQRLRGFGGTPGIPPPTRLKGLAGPPQTPSPALADKLATLLPASIPPTTPSTPTTPTTTTTTTTTQRPRPNTIGSLVDPEKAPTLLHAQEEQFPPPDPSDSVFGRRIPQNGQEPPVFEVSAGVPQPEQRIPLAPQQLSRTEKIVELPAVDGRSKPTESVERQAGKSTLHAAVSKVQHITQAAQREPEITLGPPPHLLGQIPVHVDATPPPSVENRDGATTRGPTPAHLPTPQANPGPAADPFTAVFEALNQKLTNQPPSPPTRLPGPSDDYYYYYDDYDDDYYYYDYEYPGRHLGPQRGRFRFPATNPRQATLAGASLRRNPFPAASLLKQPLAGNFPATTSLPRGFNTPFVPTTLSRVTTLAPGSTIGPIAPVTRPVLPPRLAPPPTLIRPATRAQPRPITPPPSLFATQPPVRTTGRRNEVLEGHRQQPPQEAPFKAEAPPSQLPLPQGVPQVLPEAPVAPGLPSSKPNPTSNTVFKMVSSPHPSETISQPGDPPTTLPPRPIPPPSLQQQPPLPPARNQPQFQNAGSPKLQSEELSASGPPLRAPAPSLSDPGEALEPRIRGVVGPDDHLTLLVSPEQLRRLHHTETSTPTIRKQPVYFLPPEATLPELATQIRRRRRPDARVGGLEGGSWQNQGSQHEPREERKDFPTRENTGPQEERAISQPASPQSSSTGARPQVSQQSLPGRSDLHDIEAFSNRHNKSEDSTTYQGASPRKRITESRVKDPQRSERERRPEFSRLPLIGFTGAQALEDYAKPEDASSEKDEATPQRAPEIDRQNESQIPTSHMQEEANRFAEATPHEQPRDKASTPHDDVLEEAAPFDKDFIASHDGESVPEVQGWRKDLP